MEGVRCGILILFAKPVCTIQSMDGSRLIVLYCTLYTGDCRCFRLILLCLVDTALVERVYPTLEDERLVCSREDTRGTAMLYSRNGMEWSIEQGLLIRINE